MPELPEVETVRTIIEPHVLHREIVGLTIRDFVGVLDLPDGIARANVIVGARIIAARRRGKYLILPLDNELSLIIHLRMTGRFLILPSHAPPVRFEHAAIHLDCGSDLRFGDQRKFGRIQIALQDDVNRLDKRLGPEPLGPDLSAEYLLRRFATRHGKIKSALLDQHVIAGLGNIYVDEALHRVGMHPEQAPSSLTTTQVTILIEQIRHVLRLAIEHQGTTFSSFENPYGEAGGNAAFLHVYGRVGSDVGCFRCGTPLEKIVVAGRGTTFCPNCQVNNPSKVMTP